MYNVQFTKYNLLIYLIINLPTYIPFYFSLLQSLLLQSSLTLYSHDKYQKAYLDLSVLTQGQKSPGASH